MFESPRAYQRLEALAHRARIQPALARRGRVVLAFGQGLDNKSVAKKLRCSLGLVGKWRARFLKARVEGLYDEPRPGAPRQVNDAQVEQIVVRTLETTRRGQTHWSTRGLDRATGLSRMTISHRSTEFLQFLDLIDANVPAGLEEHIIMDNYG